MTNFTRYLLARSLGHHTFEGLICRYYEIKLASTVLKNGTVQEEDLKNKCEGPREKNVTL